jgi:hypothetical protein
MAQTVSNRVPKVYNKIKEKLFNVCKEIGGIGVTLDLWKHDMTGAHYILGLLISNETIIF